MEQLSFKLECFEGPLDLLLALIGKKKIEVWDIHISEILDQYMAYLSHMRQMDMEVTSEFLAMASQLIYIKSRMLLPKLSPEEEEEDPRAELVRSLQEYQKAKMASQKLSQIYETVGTSYVRQPELIKAVEARPEDGEFQVNDLTAAFGKILLRSRRKLPPPVTSFQGIVGREKVPVSQKINHIIHSLKRYGIVRFGFLFRKAKSRSEIVATFLAVLELSKNHRIVISDTNGEEYLDSKIEISD